MLLLLHNIIDLTMAIIKQAYLKSSIAEEEFSLIISASLSSFPTQEIYDISQYLKIG